MRRGTRRRGDPLRNRGPRRLTKTGIEATVTVNRQAAVEGIDDQPLALEPHPASGAPRLQRWVSGIFGGIKGYGSVHAAELLVAMFSLWTRSEQIQNIVNKNPLRDLVLKRPEGVEDRGWRPEINSLGPSTGDAADRAQRLAERQERAGWRTHNGNQEGMLSAWSGRALRGAAGHHEGQEADLPIKAVTIEVEGNAALGGTAHPGDRRSFFTLHTASSNST